jgi:hypothetical protein
MKEKKFNCSYLKISKAGHPVLPLVLYIIFQQLNSIVNIPAENIQSP